MAFRQTTRAWLFLRSPGAMRDTQVLLLAFTAGCVDAISYLGLGHVFTANMTGNTVLLGLGLGQAQWLAALRSVAALVGYFTGVAGGTLLISGTVKRAFWPPVVTAICAIELLILTILTLAGTLLPPPSADAAVDVLILLAAAAMGLQGAAVMALGIRGVATTYITGTWTTLVSGLVSAIRTAQRAGAELPAGTGVQSAVIGTYLLAAVVGGVAATRWHLTAFVVPAVAVAAVVTTAWLRFRGQSD
jgi:uncharacterized membrane protein YoaK (UPF0700 family)